jgi:MFS family permease
VLQLLALPAALLCWFCLAHVESERSVSAPAGPSTRAALSATASLTGLAVQAPGFLRFFLKFALLTYFPIVAVRDHGMNAAGVGLAVGLAALFAVAAAAATPLALRVLGPIGCTALAVILAAGPLVAFPFVPGAVVLTIALVAAGVGDGMLGVLNNIVASIAAPPGARSAYLGITGTIRNLGKLFAPVAAGALAAALPLAGALAVLGGVGLLVLGALPRIGSLFAAENPPPGESDV